MLPLNPWLPLTDRVVPLEVPVDVPLHIPRPVPPAVPLAVPLNEEPLDPNRDPLLADELPKCEPSRFETARFGAIVELRPDEDAVIPLRPVEALDVDAEPPKFPACEFDATVGPFEVDPRDAPAGLPPACVPAVLPVFRALLALPLPPPLPNECQCPSAFAEFAAPRPEGHPDDRAFIPFEPDRDALFVALRPFAEFPAGRPAFIPFERPAFMPPERPALVPPVRPAPPYSRGIAAPPRP
jgi:hypothetical protein